MPRFIIASFMKAVTASGMPPAPVWKERPSLKYGLASISFEA